VKLYIIAIAILQCNYVLHYLYVLIYDATWCIMSNTFISPHQRNTAVMTILSRQLLKT